MPPPFPFHAPAPTGLFEPGDRGPRGEEERREWDRWQRWPSWSFWPWNPYPNVDASPRLWWSRWIRQNWASLVRERKVRVGSLGAIPDPAASGFSRLRFAQNEGQVQDWGLSLVDGSRIHLHVLPAAVGISNPNDFSGFAGFVVVAHRDRFDPAQNLYSLVRHVAGETRVGRAATVGATAWAGLRTVGAFL